MLQSFDMETEKKRKYEYEDLQYAIGTTQTVADMERVLPMQPFDETVIDFFNDLSKALLKFGRAYSDVGTFGFWCRKAALAREKTKYMDATKRLGRGTVFHSTPSNVPVNFAFSFAAGLLAGNANIVRIPGKPYEQVDIICLEIKKLLENNYSALAPYVAFVKYPPVQEITDAFCSICSTRVVWGGDGTIAEMRKSPLPPRANEITFADRHSIAVIDADGYLACENKELIAQDFYNDTYFSDQNACTAPRAVIWVGVKKEEAKKLFWNKIYGFVKEKYSLVPVQAVGKLTALYRVASQREVEEVRSAEMTQSTLITRVRVNDLCGLMEYKYNSGFFFEYDASSMDEILPLCGERCQTITYCGMESEKISDFISKCRPRGVDRVVPMGKSMEFALIWDGHDLIREMSRFITVV